LPTLTDRLGHFLTQRPGLLNILDFILRPVEIITKKPVFGCKMCGQCVLHSTGMVCPMTCPKTIRNGPCGGVRFDGNCEVYPEKACVWLKANIRSIRLPWPEEFHELRPPVDYSLQGSSSWINALTGRDKILSGCSPDSTSGLDVVSKNGS